jgi:hypothetical protein
LSNAVSVVRLKELCAASQQLETLARSVRERLLTEHVTAVYRDVVGDVSLEDDELRRLGFAPDILRCFRSGQAETFAYEPSARGFELVTEHARCPLHHARLELPSSPQSVALGLKALHDMVCHLDPQIEISVLVPRAANPAALGRLAQRWASRSAPLRFIPCRTRSLFSQDNGKAGIDGLRTRTLLVPRQLSADPRSSVLDAADLLGDAIGVSVKASRLFWEGGNVLYDGYRCLVGANTVAVNQMRLGLSADEVCGALAAEFGAAKLLVLGDENVARNVLLQQRAETHGGPDPGYDGLREYRIEAGQADFHLDLDVAPLGRLPNGKPAVALADPDAGLRHLPAIQTLDERFAGHFLPPAEMRAVLAARAAKTAERRRQWLKLYRSQLEDAGYDVLSVPDFRISPSDHYLDRENFQFNYVNVVPHGSPEQPRVCLWRYGVHALDSAAYAAYRASGIEITTLAEETTANETSRLYAGPHCVVSKLA